MKVTTISREKMMAFLTEKGCNVVGTTEEFDGSQGGIWISAESTSRLFNYYSEGWMDTFGVQPALNDSVEENGWYFEWHDAGTIMVWQD